MAIIKKICQKRGEVSTEGKSSTRHPNMLVHLVTLGLILIIKLSGGFRFPSKIIEGFFLTGSRHAILT